VLRFGYNTNGFAHHRLEDALALLGEIGYQGVALTLDVHHLDPFRSSPRDVERIQGLLRRFGLEPVVETGARYLLDPRRKHEPTLLSSDGAAFARRFDFLRRCLRIGADLGAGVVSLWSGRAPEGAGRDTLFARFGEALGKLCDEAATFRLSVALEPEPGMLVERLSDYARIRDAVLRPNLGLCLDVGHLYATGEDPPGPAVRAYAAEILTAHIEDAPRGRHEHLPFGEGVVDLPEVLGAFRAIGYRGLLNVELSRSSHEAPEVARRSLAILREALGPPR
jgi:sugar phosphate isomerase/epimerase